MANDPLSPSEGDHNHDFAADCRLAAEEEFRQLARIWRYSIITGNSASRDLALRDMLAAPVFEIESLRQKVDAVRGEGAREWVVDRGMTARQVIALDAVRVASGMSATDT